MDGKGLTALGLVVIAGAVPYFGARAQDSTLVVGSIVSAATGADIPYATFSFSPGPIRRFTNARGGFSARLQARQQYRLGIRQVGYLPLDTTVTPNPGAGLELRLQLHPVAYKLGAVRTVVRRACAEENAADVGGILEEIKKNAEREIVLRESYPFQYQMERTNRFEGSRDAQRDTAMFFSRNRDPYRVGRLVRERQSAAGSEREMRIPQLTDLANENFLANHCFYFGGVRRAGGIPVYVIDFEPTGDLKSPDVRGSVLLDTATLRIRRANFALTNAEDLYPRVGALEVTTTYRDLFAGVALFDEISSVETFERERPADPLQRHIETQRLLGVKFLAASPQDLDSAAVRAIAARPSSDEPVQVAAQTSRATDSVTARAVIAQAMEKDLTAAGFYQRRARFPRGLFLTLDQVDQRAKVDSTNLIPELRGLQIGTSGPGAGSASRKGGLAVSSDNCPVNLYVNGKPSSVPTGDIAGIRRTRLTFGPELTASRIGAIEIYPRASSSAPSEFPRDVPGCDLVVLWTRPEVQSVKK